MDSLDTIRRTGAERLAALRTSVGLCGSAGRRCDGKNGWFERGTVIA